MPLVYERACAPRPNLFDPRAPGKPAGFGPIPPEWPDRARLLGATDRRVLDAPILDIPDVFDWSYFQVAPPDQQIDALRGDEWIVLDGLHPTLPRVQTRLPGLAAVARVDLLAPGDPSGGEILVLSPDTLAIQGDRQSCEVVFRGSFVVPGGAPSFPLLHIVAGLDLPRPVATAVAPAAPATAPARRAPATTKAFSLSDELLARTAKVLPFERTGGAPEPMAGGTVAGAPWAALPAALGDPTDETLLLQAPGNLRVHRDEERSAPRVEETVRPKMATAPPARPRPPSRAPALPLKGSVYGKPKQQAR
jgi:hypothetical protein